MCADQQKKCKIFIFMTSTVWTLKRCFFSMPSLSHSFDSRVQYFYHDWESRQTENRIATDGTEKASTKHFVCAKKQRRHSHTKLIERENGIERARARARERHHYILCDLLAMPMACHYNYTQHNYNNVQTYFCVPLGVRRLAEKERREKKLIIIVQQAHLHEYTQFSLQRSFLHQRQISHFLSNRFCCCLVHAKQEWQKLQMPNVKLRSNTPEYCEKQNSHLWRRLTFAACFSILFRF